MPKQKRIKLDINMKFNILSEYNKNKNDCKNESEDVKECEAIDKAIDIVLASLDEMGERGVELSHKVWMRIRNKGCYKKLSSALLKFGVDHDYYPALKYWGIANLSGKYGVEEITEKTLKKAKFLFNKIGKTNLSAIAVRKLKSLERKKAREIVLKKRSKDNSIMPMQYG